MTEKLSVIFSLTSYEQSGKSGSDKAENGSAGTDSAFTALSGDRTLFVMSCVVLTIALFDTFAFPGGLLSNVPFTVIVADSVGFEILDVGVAHAVNGKYRGESGVAFGFATDFHYFGGNVERNVGLNGIAVLLRVNGAESEGAAFRAVDYRFTVVDNGGKRFVVRSVS